MSSDGPSADARVILYLIRKIYGWNKTTDKISYSQIQKETGVNYETARTAVRKLCKAGVIIKQSTRPATYALVSGDILPDSNGGGLVKSQQGGGEISPDNPVKSHQYKRKKDIITKEKDISGEGDMTYTKEEESNMKKAFDVWCSLKHTIHHTALTAAFKTHLNPAIKRVGLNDLIAAFTNYDEAIGREDIKWTYDLWKIDQFCLRGLDRFLPQNKPLERMKIGGKNVKGRNDGSNKTTVLQ